MISDGFGPASETFAREMQRYEQSSQSEVNLVLDSILVGTSSTRSYDSLVTDSAAGATAFACALKTYNGAVGVDHEKKPCGTVLEAAKAIGMSTGLVATSRITHATPASFSSHNEWRDNEADIASQQIGDNPLGRQVDLMFGGGRCFFTPKTLKNSCRGDDRDLLNEAIRNGSGYIQSRKELFGYTGGLPLIGLFANDHMAFEIDRDGSLEPSLSEMTRAALNLLVEDTRNKDQGFFLMVEGNICAHNNDAACHYREIMEYQNTVRVVKEFVSSHPYTVMISVADHETGGLTLGRQISPLFYPEYRWLPQYISGVKNSIEMLTNLAQSNSGADDLDKLIKFALLEQGLTIHDYTDKDVFILQSLASAKYNFMNYLAEMVNSRAELGMSTHGHTGVDVNLYAYGYMAHLLHGRRVNTQIGDFIVNLLGLDLAKVTRRLNSHDVSKKPFSCKYDVKGDGYAPLHYHQH